MRISPHTPPNHTTPQPVSVHLLVHFLLAGNGLDVVPEELLGLTVVAETADEKFKKLLNGGVNRHVYYRCTKSKDRNCKNPALNETGLIEALLKMADTLSLDKVKLTAKLNSEIQKFKKLQAMFLGTKKTEKIEPIDLRDYAKFVLRDGTVLEQRSVLECVSSELVLKSGKISIS